MYLQIFASFDKISLVRAKKSEILMNKLLLQLMKLLFMFKLMEKALKTIKPSLKE